MILRPVIDWFIWSGALPPPDAGDYTVEWPFLFELTSEQQAGIRLTNAQAQREEWDGAQIPAITRWREVKGDGALAGLLEDWGDTPEIREAGVEL